MANKLLIDGVVFAAPNGRQINTSNPYSLQQQSGGIRVDWGGGDIETLPGTSATISEIIAWYSQSYVRASFSACVPYNSSYWLVPSGTAPLREMENHPTIPDSYSPPPSNVLLLEDSFSKSHQYVRGFSNCAQTVTVWNVIVNGRRIQDYSYQRQPPQFFTDRCGWKVTDNLGNTSQRFKSAVGANRNPPIVSEIGEGCVLIVYYLDGSSSQLTFDECPQDIRLIEDEICQSACNKADEIIRRLGRI